MTGYHSHAELKQGRFGKPADLMFLLLLTSEGGPDRPEGDHEKLTARHCKEDQITLQPHPPDYHQNLSVLRPLMFQSSLIMRNSWLYLHHYVLLQ